MPMLNRKSSPSHCEPLAEAHNAALRLLARREHSVFELHHKLRHRGFAPAVIDAVFQQLVAEDWLNDNRYAEVYAHSRADKGYGPLRIQRELGERGVSEEIITAALNPLEDFWMPRLAALYRKRFAGVRPRDAAGQAGQVRFLRQRGFTLEQINGLFRSLEALPRS
jgi:regulatory protein